MRIGWLILILSCFSSCNDTPYVQGERLYNLHCQNCHMEDGSGLKSLIKPLDTSDYLGKNEMVCIIRSGILDTIKKDKDFLPKEMPSFKKISPVEMANLINYINYRWDKNFKEKSILDVQHAIIKCE